MNTIAQARAALNKSNRRRKRIATIITIIALLIVIPIAIAIDTAVLAGKTYIVKHILGL